MKIFKFIISKIFLRKAILGICVMLLLCMANYITFTAARSILSTFQGYQETKYVNQEGVYIANLDPDSHIDMGIVGENAPTDGRLLHCRRSVRTYACGYRRIAWAVYEL